MSSISTLWFSAENIQHASHRSPWKGIVHVLPSFIPFTKLSLGNGSSIRFWLDPWSCPTPLASRFPRLFNLSVLQEGFVSSFFSYPSNWSFHLRRKLIDPEIQEFAVLSDILH